jgi:hypothetical protein
MPTITEVAEYRGQSAVRVAATQLGSKYSPSQARRVVAEWVDFLAAGPTQILDLHFVSRTPKRLFEALRGQTQLQRLRVKWGDYEDLGVVAGMTELRYLVLGGASSVESLQPLAQLTRVETLDIESLRNVHDLTPIGSMTTVTSLSVGGNWMSPRIAHVDSIAFIRGMPQLRSVVLHTLIVDDHDYSPLLALPNLESVGFMKTRGMRPSFEVLKANLPWHG